MQWLGLSRTRSWIPEQDPRPSQVAETCQLALARIEAVRGGAAVQAGIDSPYLSVDPTPAAPASTPLPALRAALLDEAAPLTGRYAAMFALRNRGDADAVAALAEAFDCRSALLKHEVAYVLGQMQDAEAFHVLKCAFLTSHGRKHCLHSAAACVWPHRSLLSDSNHTTGCLGQTPRYCCLLQ